MTDMASAPSIDEIDDEFDLDIRIDDIGPADPNRIHLASVAMSCSMCCPGETPGYSRDQDLCHTDVCTTRVNCTMYTECLCAG
jgi:hypothetical protein